LPCHQPSSPSLSMLVMRWPSTKPCGDGKQSVSRFVQPVDEGIVAVALYEYEAAEEGELSAFSPQLGLPHQPSSPSLSMLVMRWPSTKPCGDGKQSVSRFETVFPSNYVEEQ
jgi:hypothetical protein